MTTSVPFDENLTAFVLEATDASVIGGTEVVQSLWSGYGQIVRCQLVGSPHQSVILKHIRWPDEPSHPRGWASDRSHQRKLKSYQVEAAWYGHFAERCPVDCRVPRCLAVDDRPDGALLLLEDLNTVGFAGRSRRVTDNQVAACLSWLASFHATFLGAKPTELWATGTYWHLDTRPDEYDALPEGPLKAAAGELDRRLSDSPFQTFVHGDAKLANFCFGQDGWRAAAVDFQYVGGGCGMKDVAYFLSSCFDEQECERRESAALDHYFDRLQAALQRTGADIDCEALEADWRRLYAVAWTDFFRFLQGWSPGHWKAHRYSQRLADEVLGSL